LGKSRKIFVRIAGTCQELELGIFQMQIKFFIIMPTYLVHKHYYTESGADSAKALTNDKIMIL
jgi:hypothetical protein